MHEQDALRAYKDKMTAQHTNMAIRDAGLFISQERPYIGASPDAIVMCDCYGQGVVEVKCPYCFKESLQRKVLKIFV